MKTIYFLLIFLLSLIVFIACKDPYMPELRNLNKNILVVEGYIDGSNGTNILLSRVKSLGEADTAFQKFVEDASVTIEDNQGNKFPLANTGHGNYKGNYNLNKANKYHLIISTSDQKNYVSEFVEYKISPPIQSISYKIEKDGARFYVSTQDYNNKSTFYRWKFDETWQFHSFYRTNLKYDKEKRIVVKGTEPIYLCWQSDHSREILINSTANLSQDFIQEMPINFIPNESYKLSDVYSINVRQYVMDSIGYNYYRQLKKNTEETGSIFDPQPGNLRGNIKNTNDLSEIVVGYIGAGSSYQVRQYFQIPWKFNDDCLTTFFVPNRTDSLEYYFGFDENWPLYYDGIGDAYKAAERKCADCTVRGTNIKPSFWP